MLSFAEGVLLRARECAEQFRDVMVESGVAPQPVDVLVPPIFLDQSGDGSIYVNKLKRSITMEPDALSIFDVESVEDMIDVHVVKPRCISIDMAERGYKFGVVKSNVEGWTMCRTVGDDETESRVLFITTEGRVALVNKSSNVGKWLIDLPHGHVDDMVITDVYYAHPFSPRHVVEESAMRVEKAKRLGPMWACLNHD